ncbi:MAG: hypothetical protein HYZ25_16550 [Chloroflexi bacterium]|nr:hypothetical protein [Chloroflexota bacterium]
MNQSSVQDAAQVTVTQPHSAKESFLSRAFLIGMVIWLGVSLLFWAWYLSALEFVVPFLYMYVWLLLIGLPLWIQRKRVEAALQNWKASPMLKFVLLGYGMVLLEEIFAAFFNHLTEGFQLPLFLARIGQFWALNVFAFSGLILGWHFLLSRFRYSRLEAFMLVGAYGLFSERIYTQMFANPIAFLFLAAPTVFIYGQILSPSILSLTQHGTRHLPAAVRWLMGLLLPFLVAIPFLLILNSLRTWMPDLFPPRNFIP